MEWVENGVWVNILSGQTKRSSSTEALNALLIETFACEHLSQEFRAALEIHLAETAADEAATFFETPVGHKVAVKWADLAFSSSAIKIQTYFSGPLVPKGRRAELLHRIEAATFFSENRWLILTVPSIGIVRGYAVLNGFDPDVEEEKTRESWSMGLDYYYVDLEAASLACQAYQYRQLTDTELETFALFAESPTGEKFYSALNRSIADTLEAVATNLEESIPKRFPPPPPKPGL